MITRTGRQADKIIKKFKIDTWGVNDWQTDGV